MYRLLQGGTLLAGILTIASFTAVLALPQPAAAKPAVQARTKPAPPPALITGKVEEVLTANGYTYVRLNRGGENVWLSMIETPVRPGELMSFKPGTQLHNYKHKGLGRTFETLIFSGGVAR